VLSYSPPTHSDAVRVLRVSCAVVRGTEGS
jgi:hypothetical protein